MASDAGKILKSIEDNEIEWVDLRFTDPKGKWQHLSMVASAIDEDQLTDEELKAMDEEIRGVVDDAAKFADESPEPEETETTFAGNARLTFSYRGAISAAFVRFLALSSVSLIMTTLWMAWVVRSGLPMSLYVLVVILTVPPVTYLLSRFWVFAPRSSH